MLEQRIGRIHRLGQERPIDVFNLMTRGSIEERIASLVADKRALFKGLFEGTTDELRFDGGSAITAVLDRLTADLRADATVDGVDTVDTADDELTERLDGQASPDSVVVANEGADASAVVGGTAAAEPGPIAPLVAPTLGDGDRVASLFSAVAVKRRDDGGVVIEAPPEAARALVALFEGMSRLMAAAAPPQT